uniref:Uncharacterized protein n=1 Tax=Amphimedon queenslandica TaxID=400682 RepID=A0A1X7VT95_AMPQE
MDDSSGTLDDSITEVTTTQEVIDLTVSSQDSSQDSSFATTDEKDFIIQYFDGDKNIAFIAECPSYSTERVMHLFLIMTEKWSALNNLLVVEPVLLL